MKANRIFLQNFRNYESQQVEFDRDLVIIYGKNAQGKTYRDSEMIRFEQPAARVSLEFTANGRQNKAEMELSSSRRKSISVNEVPVKKNSELVGKFKVVYFDPDYLEIVKGGPKVRRRNLDVFISQLRPNYFSYITALKRILESKSALLKSAAPNPAMLEILNQKLADNAAAVIAYRMEYIKKLEKVSQKIQLEISGGTEQLEVRYLSCIGETEGLSVAEIRNRMSEKLESAAKRETENRECSVGPHREDINYLIGGREVRAYGSQGQQKTTVLVQKLAEAEIMKEEAGEYPVLLFDDIMSEMDNSRQDYILRQLKNMQIFITCTDKQRFQDLENARFLRVENGTVIKEE